MSAPATDITWMGLGASLLLVAVAVVVSLSQRLRLAGSILWSVVRAGVQLAVVGVALGVVLAPDAPVGLAWVWVALMVAFAALTVQRRVPQVPGAFGVSLLACATVAVVSLGVVFGLGVFPPEPRAIVPLAGMMIGNSMAATVVAARRIVEELGSRRGEVEARLALGYAGNVAIRPSLRAAMRTGVTTQIETTKAVGLVILPGAMTGLILAGVDASDAVMVQLVIMYLILGSVATSVAVVGLGLGRRLVTPDHRLADLPRVAT